MKKKNNKTQWVRITRHVPNTDVDDELKALLSMCKPVAKQTKRFKFVYYRVYYYKAIGGADITALVHGVTDPQIKIFKDLGYEVDFINIKKTTAAKVGFKHAKYDM